MTSAAPSVPGELPLDEDSIAYAGALGQAELLRSGQLTSVQLVDLLLARIGRLDGRINAFRMVLADAARAEAAAADQARAAGDDRPLLGVPIAIKDTVAVAGTAAMCGTGSLEPEATEDDELVRRIRAAGLVVIGKTHLPELAMWAATESISHGITRNPWDPRRAPGGSSGGSAAAVAAGMVAAAHATDGLGSIRIPASCCGLVGLKPTHDFLPVGDHWQGLSHAGFLTRSVRDTAALLDATADPHPRLADAIAAGTGRLRVAATTKAATPTGVKKEIRQAVDRAAALLRDLGHTVTATTPPYGPAVVASNTARYLAGVATDSAGLADPKATERRTRVLSALGRRLSPERVTGAREVGRAFAAEMDGFFNEYDLVLTPTMPVLPRKAGGLVRRGTLRTLTYMLPCAAFTGPWNASGLPAISLPVGTTSDGLPIGVQLIGPAHSEGRLLSVAAEMERVIGWTDRRVDPDRTASPLR